MFKELQSDPYCIMDMHFHRRLRFMLNAWLCARIVLFFLLLYVCEQKCTGWLKKSKLLYCVNSLLFLSHPVVQSIYMWFLALYDLWWYSQRLQYRKRM